MDVVADILDVARRRIMKTHLMLHCSMNFTQLEKYLDFILEAELLTVENNGPHLIFKTSRKGKSFLKTYNSLKALME